MSRVVLSRRGFRILCLKICSRTSGPLLIVWLEEVSHVRGVVTATHQTENSQTDGYGLLIAGGQLENSK